MVGMAGATLRRAADVYEWLARREREDVSAESVMDAIRSACGSVPLGGTAATGVSTPTTDAAATTDAESAFWAIVLAQCALPASTAAEQRKTALQELAKSHLRDGDKSARFTWQAAAAIREQYYAERRAFFAVRIELLRIALFVAPEAHPNFDVVDEIVEELLKEGLVDALVDEVVGRAQHALAGRPDFAALPTEAPEHALHQHAAQQAWELQLLDEAALLRHTLVLALYASKDKVDGASAVATAKALSLWDNVVVPDAFTSSTLALPRAHARVREASQLGVLASVRMLHVASRLPLSQASWDALLSWSPTVIAATDSSTSDAVMAEDQPPLRASTAGVLALALAALLAHQYTELRSRVPDAEALERALQDALAAAERLHSFYHVNVLLRALAFRDASHDDDDDMATDDVGPHHSGDSVMFPFTQPMAIDASASWQLPPVALTKHARHERPAVGSAYCVAIVQRVGADLLNDVLGSLGYLDSLGAESLHQLHAMVKLVTPVLANASVAEATLSVLANGDDASDEPTGHGLAALVHKTKALLPASLLPCMQLLTALSANVDGLSPSPVLRHVLKELAKPLSSTQASALAPPRLLPPDDYLAPRSSTPGDARVVCARSFYYEDDQLAIPAGTTGRVVDVPIGSSDSDDDDSLAAAAPQYVQWHLDQSDDRCGRLTIWDLVFEAMETAVAHVQTSSLRHAGDIETLTSVLEWIVQASRADASGSVVNEIGRRWSEARLRSWWRARHLPSLDDVLPLLLREHVSLSALERASREDLVAWGVRDRSIRDHVLAHVASSSSRGLQQASVPRTAEAFALDGVAHLVRLLFGFLDSFLHETDRVDDDDVVSDDDASASTRVHFVSAILSALSALTSVDACVRVIIDDLGGGSDECVGLVLTSARKVFESHERLTGHYPVVLAALDVAMNVVRWFLAQEARAVDATSASASGSALSRRDFAAAERTWFVGAVEFAVEILSTHESWKFAALATKWELTDRCFRVLYAILAAAFVPDDNAMLQGLQTALRKTLTTDVTLVMKLLRSTCGVVSIRHHALKHWNSISTAAMELDGDDCVVPQPITRSAAPSSSAKTSERRDAGLYPLTFATELDAPTELARLEALVVTALRLLDLLLTPSSDAARGVVDYKTASLLLLTPIDDGGPKARKALNLVTLCGGYLAYSVTKRRAIVAASLQILHHAAVFLERRDSPASSSSFDAATHSLSALFQSGNDMASVRDAMLRLLRSSLDEVGIGKALLTLLTTCLAHQPGFVAYVLFDVDEASDESTATSPVKTQRLVALIERFLVASEQLMEEATDLFCHVLQFLVRVWHGATRERRALDVQIVQGLRASSHFWGHLTRALKIRMALDGSDGRVAMNAVGLDSPSGLVTDRRSAYVGRSSPFAYVARGYILQIISYEWHARGAASKTSGDDALTQVLETFRTEDLYSHWLRTFTRLDYAPSRFAELCRSVQPYASAAHRDVLKRLDATADAVPTYARGLLCDASVLAWQLDGARGSDGRSTRAVLQRVQWCNLQSAYVQAQGFALSQWKVFMELCCFLDAADAAETTSAPAPAPASPAVNRFKRKESMISSPPRLSSTARTVPPSPLDLGVGAKASSFAGDRTSFGMIQVLADILGARQARDGDAALDLVGLAHVHDMLELLVSMLHHQLRQVVTKTRDPKLSQTRPRPTQSRLTVAMSVRLLRLVEKTAQRVEHSLVSASRASDRDVAMGRSGDDAAALWPQLVHDYADRVETVGIQLRTALLTAALLLVRHVVATSGAGSTSGASDSVDPHESAILQVKLVHHCMRAITECDAAAPRAHAPALQALFQVSWCLVHDILDGFVHVAGAPARLDSVVTLRPLVMLLEHEQHGLAALFQVLVQRFRVKAPSPTTAADQRAAQTQVLQVLTGLTTVVWNAQNRDLWRRVLIDSATSELRVLPLLATELVPLLSAQMALEDAATGLRGYAMVDTDGGKSTERSVAHQMWCALLRFAAGLLQLLEPSSTVLSSATGVWELLARGEPLLLAALEPSARLTLARVDEQTSALALLNAVSRVGALKAQWKQGLPRNWALLMEQSRLVVRRACVLLGSSLSETKRRQQLTKTTKASNATVSFAHQTLLHEHLQAVEASEKRALSAFYRATERQLAELVRQSAALLLKWTASLAARDAVIVVDGVRYIDTETLVPLLALAPPTQALSMSCAPSLGHVCLAMDFAVDQLEAHDASESSSSRATASALGNTVDTCALLVLKTLVLHLERFDCPKSDVEDLKTFFARLAERVRTASAATSVDDQLLDTLVRVCALREA